MQPDLVHDMVRRASVDVARGHLLSMGKKAPVDGNDHVKAVNLLQHAHIQEQLGQNDFDGKENGIMSEE